jgi:uncharacterized protein (DUF924 family)
MPYLPSSEESAEPSWVGAVLHYWFEELGRSHWFSKNDATDAQIRDRFFELHARLMAQDDVDVGQPLPILAAVIVLDQFSRNMFRESPRAYAADSIARRLARVALERGFDLTMTPAQRYFLYLPFEHSESVEDQALAVRLISALGDEEWTRFAVAHQVIIDRFGRFPHRNAVLGRISTAEEDASLQLPMSSF